MGNSYHRLENYNEQINCYKEAARLGFALAREWLKKNNHSW
jgi:hypothetical protein